MHRRPNNRNRRTGHGLFAWSALWFPVVALVACHGIPMNDETSVSPDASRVVVLHGLKRSSWSMKKIEWRLEKAGFEVCNVDYPSGRKPVDELVEHILDDIDTCFGQDPGPINFVSHSLGGLMIRAMQVTERPPQIARAVMIAPPNHGSELVDLHRNSTLFRMTMGPTAVLLGTDPGSLPHRLGPAQFDVGVIAGVGRSNPLGLWVFDEPNDGTVSVASTRLAGMSDFIEVPYGHTFIMRKGPVIDEVVHYLRDGAFSARFKPGDTGGKP